MATKKLTKVQQQLINNGFYLAKVTMYRKDSNGWPSDIIDTFTGYIKVEGTIVWKERKGARTRFLSEICTTAQRLIRIEEVGA